MPYTVVTDAASEPLTKAETRLHLKNEGITADDDLLDIYIKAARQLCEEYTNTALLSKTISQVFDVFPKTDAVKNPFGALELTVTPVISVSSVIYKDADGDNQTISASNYDVDTTTRFARVAPVSGYTWPSTYSGINAVTVQYLAGYSSTTTLPAPFRSAMLLTIGHWYINREDSPRRLSTQAEWILKRYTVKQF